MLFQPSNITPDEINGTGTVDVTQDVTITWEVNGNSAMTAYQISFYQNDAASTPVWNTGEVTLGTPFWGVSYDGTEEPFSVTLSGLSTHGLSNGNEYKMLITQWWSANDSVTQFTASLILARQNPTLTMTAIPSPLTDKEASFTATYSQAQGDAIKWVQWEIAYADDESNPFVDTGRIYGTGQLQVDYDGFLTDTTYAVRCTIETQNGVQATTGWVEFNVSYSLSTTTSGATACQLADSSSVWVSWDRIESADGYSIMRQTVGENRLIKISDVEATAGQIRDYSARSGQSYIYYVFPEGNLAYLTEPMQTDPVSVQYWYWAIVEAEPVPELKNTYSAIAAYYFKYGSGGVAEGQISNNNNPQISQNFTKYPTRQGITSNYKTGTLSGYIGTIDRAKMEYKDTIAQSEALFALSNTENALFVKVYKDQWNNLIDALESDTEAQEVATKLAEKEQALEDARLALENANKQRTIRTFNASTGQWEWVADQSKIKSAQESLTKAEKDYAEEVKDQAIKELERLRDTMADLNNVVLGPALSAIMLKAESSDEFQNFARSLNAVYGIGSYLGSTQGSSKVLSTKDSHDTIYTFGNVTLTEEQASSMSVAELAKKLRVLKIS